MKRWPKNQVDGVYVIYYAHLNVKNVLLCELIFGRRWKIN